MHGGRSVASGGVGGITRRPGEGGRGAGAPPAFQLGEQGEQKRPFEM